MATIIDGKLVSKTISLGLTAPVYKPRFMLKQLVSTKFFKKSPIPGALGKVVLALSK